MTRTWSKRYDIEAVLLVENSGSMALWDREEKPRVPVGNPPVADAAIERLKQSGVTVVLAYIEPSTPMSVEQARSYYGHGAEIFAHIKDLSQMVKWGEKVVTTVVKKRIPQRKE